jgi:hypothetical protein
MDVATFAGEQRSSWDSDDDTLAAYPWYDRGTYDRIREVMVDSDLMPAAYEHWLAQAEQVLVKLRRDGMKPARVCIEPDGFLAWCREQDCYPDGSARLAYAEYQLLHAAPAADISQSGAGEWSPGEPPPQ